MFLAADLSLTKTVDDPSPNPNQNVSFVVTVANGGPDTATGIVVRDLLPSGLQLLFVTPSQGSYTTSTGLWNVGLLDNGASATLSLIATVRSPGLTNTAEIIASSTSDPDSTPNNHLPGEDDQASVTLSSPPAADLSLTKTVDDATPDLDQTVMFTVQVTNSGPIAATGVSVTDRLPTGLAFLASTATQGGYSSDTGVWNVGTLNNGATASLQIVALVLTAGAKLNTAEVTTADQFDPDSTPGNQVTGEDDQATVVIETASTADLFLTKTVDDNSPDPDQNVSFVVTVANSGPLQATGVVVRDLLPAGMQLVFATPSQGSYSTSTGLWTVGTLNANTSATLSLVATVRSVANPTNTAELIAVDQPDPDSTPGNNDPEEDDQASVTLLPVFADLSLSKSVNNATPAFGSNVTFVLTAANAGPAAATGVVVRDLLPSGLQLTSATPSQGAYVSSTGLWTVGTINSGSSATLTLTANVLSLGVLTNTAEVTAAGRFDSDSTPGNNVLTEDDQTSVSLTVPFADLSVSKSVNDTTPDLNSNVTFVVSVANAGPSIVTNVTVRDLLPTGLAFFSATPSQGTYNSTTGLWSAGAIDTQGSATLTLIATVQSLSALTNTAELVAAGLIDPDSTPGNNVPTEDDQASVIIDVVDSADLSLTKTVDDAAPDLNQTIAFTITVTNSGPHTATTVVVQDRLPAGLEFVSAIPSQGAFGGSQRIWNVGALAPNASATLTLRAAVRSTALLTNVAEVIIAAPSDPDSTPGNNVPTEDDQASISVDAPNLADLSVTKTVSNATPLLDQTVVFTVAVANGGPENATGVAVRDLLPVGLNFVDASASQGSYVPATGIWTVGALGNGATASLTIAATVRSTAVLINTAELTSASPVDPDSTPGNNNPSEDDQATVAIDAPPRIDLSLTKTVDDINPGRNQPINFTIQVQNAGPDQATGVLVSDLLPAGLIFVSSSASRGSYSSSTGIWTVGMLNSGSAASLQIAAMVATSNSLINVAEVSAANQTDVDSIPGNGDPLEDDRDIEIIVPQDIDLSLTKSVDDTTPDLNQNVTFTVAVTNSGLAAATGVAVTDRLAAGLTFVSSTATQGSYNSATGVWNVGALGTSATATLRVVVTVTTGGTKTNTAEVTAADQFDIDSTPNNGQPGEDDRASVTLSVPQSTSGVALRSGTLEVLATSQRDVIAINQNRGILTVSGTFAGSRFNQSFIPAQVQRIAISLGDGNDSLTISSAVWALAIVDAGAGDDSVSAGRGSAILLGGAGNDILKGGSTRDILIGGTGADQLTGGTGNDLLIAGTTSYDANQQALFAIQQEWNSTRTLTQRMNNIRAGTGPFLAPLGVKLKQNETVFNDAEIDTLFGSADLDWFFVDTTKDKTPDRTSQEAIN